MAVPDTSDHDPKDHDSKSHDSGATGRSARVSSPLTEPFRPITTRAWWHPHLDPEERRRVLNELAVTRVEHWAWRFTVMLTLSVVVAVMGLSADSAAVVIGAMLIAPLMTPVLATAASLAMSLKRKSLESLLKVALATAWSIAIAYALSRLLPDGPLPGEVEARTRPDIRDLVVALAAGAAGSYATVRKDASSALPGVAVAVALVPPLATVGITLEAGESALAIGALLLYGTNLAAIVFAGVLVFIATGFVPTHRLANTAVQLGVAGLVAFALVVIIAIPLFSRSSEAVAAAEDEVTANAIVSDWLEGFDLDFDVDVERNVERDRVLVSLRGFERPPDDAELEVDLKQALGDVNVLVEWVRTERATTTIPVTPTEEEAMLADIEPIVAQWLADNDDGADYELQGVGIVDGVLRINVAGAGQPPSVESLDDLLTAEFGAHPAVRLNWTPREAITPDDERVTPIELAEEQMRDAVDFWAIESDVTVENVSYDGERVTIDVIGEQAPIINDLVATLEAIADSDVDIAVGFTQRQMLTTTVLYFDPFPGIEAGGPGGPTTSRAEAPAPTTTTATTTAGG